MTEFYYNSEREAAQRFIDRYKELVDMGYQEHFMLDELSNYVEVYESDDEYDDELPDLLQLKDDIKVEIYRVDGLTEDQKQEITTIVQDAIHSYEE